MSLKMRQLKVHLNQESHHEDHSEQFNIYPDYYGYCKCADTVTVVELCACRVQEIPELETFDEALRSPHAKEWKLAIDTSINISLTMTHGI